MLSAYEWNELWASVPNSNKAHDEASEAVIDRLVSLGHQPSDESAEDDPIILLQSAMEIGYLLCMESNDMSFTADDYIEVCQFGDMINVSITKGQNTDHTEICISPLYSPRADNFGTHVRVFLNTHFRPVEMKHLAGELVSKVRHPTFEGQYRIYDPLKIG